MAYILDPIARVAALDIHAQKSFTELCPDELPVPGGNDITAELNAQASFASLRLGAKEAHNPKAIWLADDEHPQLSPVKGDHVDVRWRAHCITGSKGFELLDGLPAIHDYDYYVWQGVELDMHPYGVCYHDLDNKLSTGIIEFLQVRNISTVLVGGLATDYCVKTSVLQLRRADFNVVINLAACRGLSPETTDAALNELKQAGVILVESADELSNHE